MSLVRWANAKVPDRGVTFGALGIKVREYRGEEEEASLGVSGLNVSIAGLNRGKDVFATYHESTGIYGFANLATGTYRVNIRDTGNRYLERVDEFTIPPREPVEHDLLLGRTPSNTAHAAASVMAETLVRPQFGMRPGPGQTVVWGFVGRGAERPSPYARVEATIGGRHFATYADVQGVYLVWIRGLRPADEEAPEDGTGDTVSLVASPTTVSVTPPVRVDANLVAWELVAPPSPAADPLTAFPVGFDAIAFSAETVAPAAYRPLPQPPDPPWPRRILAGRTTRIDLIGNP